MIELLHETIVGMLNDGKISIRRLKSFIYIKSFINRVSTKKFIEEAAIQKLEKKYGVRPTIITWGDYFQIQMAMSLLVLSDEEFERSVETLKFDIIASCEIFSEKGREFFEWVELTYMAITNYKHTGFTEEEKEILHLKILMDYYENLGIVNNFTETEMHWFAGFDEAKAQ